MNRQITLLQIKDVSKSFEGSAGLRTNILEEINFSVDASDSGSQGSIISILAPFGSGKSTLLKIISGIENPSDGEVLLNGKNIHHSGMKIPYLPEKPSSFPWLNVKQNLEFGMKVNKNSTKEIDIQNLIDLVGLKGYESHFPNNRSLGFRFRIELARALTQNPALILIDDSFKAMDSETREEVYNLLVNVSIELKKVFVISTTNVVEAIRLSDRILLMSSKPGKIIKEIVSEPESISKEEPFKSEKFTYLKNEIENAFSTAKIISTINFSV